ncbi:hypothetical protein AAG906_039182 [Vitis piasezkii]
MNEFQPLVVGNDWTVACMLAVPSKYGMSSVQLFIEQAPNHYHLSNEMDHFTRLLACDTDVDDENERDDRNDAINTNEIHLSNDDENCCERENIDLVMVQQIVECENTRYVNLEVGCRSNNPEVEYNVENTSPVASPHGTQVNISNDNLEATFALVSYHMPPTQQFLNMDGAINCVVNEEFTPYIEAKIKAKVVKEDMDTRLFPARPNPEDTSVLTFQHQHQSSTIRVDPDMGHVDWPLITTLVERWLPKTHTFHMLVAILFGLHVHGHPVTGSTDIDWHALCEELLGVRQTETDIHGTSLRVRFITTHFSHLPPGVLDEVTLQHHARAYLLLLVGGSLFPDKKGTYLQLVILPMLRDFAHLYQELCRASLDSAETIAGPLQFHLSRSLPHAPVPIDERFLPDALGSRWRVPLSHTDTSHHVLVLWLPYTNDILALLLDIHLFDWRLYHERYVVLWEVRGDHIVTVEPIKLHMDYHALYMTWYRRITRRFITPMDDFGPMRYQTTALSIHLLVCHALEDSDSDAYRTIVDIIRMATDVMCIIWSPAQSTVARLPLVRGWLTSRGRGRYISCQPITLSYNPPISLDLPSVQAPTSSDPPSVQPPTSLALPPLQPSTFSNPPSMQIDTSAQLDLSPTIPRGKRGLRRLRLLPPPPPLFPAPSQTDVLHLSHAVLATVREERPKRKRVLVTHRFSPCGGM